MHATGSRENEKVPVEVSLPAIGTTETPWRHVLVTTDLSPSAEPALEIAADLARRASAQATLIHVLDLKNAGDSNVLRDTLVRIEQEYRTQIHPRVEELAQRTFRDVPVSVALVEGDGVAESIGKYAREHDVDLIVIATHGRTGAKRFLIGSVAESVVQQSPCDVLVVRGAPEPMEC